MRAPDTRARARFICTRVSERERCTCLQTRNRTRHRRCKGLIPFHRRSAASEISFKIPPPPAPRVPLPIRPFLRPVLFRFAVDSRRMRRKPASLCEWIIPPVVYPGELISTGVSPPKHVPIRRSVIDSFSSACSAEKTIQLCR